MNSGILFIITVNLALGLAAGFIMHRSDFCVAGMFRDFFLFKRTVMLRSLLLLVVSSMILFDTVRRLGFLPLYPFPILGSPSIMNMVGGMLFGIGMVLAGGCVAGTLYKMGSGSLISGTAFIGLIIGSGIYAEIHPWWAALTKKSIFLEGNITLPQAIGIDPAFIMLPIVLVSFFFFYRWITKGQWTIFSTAEKYLQPWKAAVLLSVLGSLSYLFIGMPFGISTAYAKIAAYLELLFIPVHAASLQFFNGVPLNYNAPLSNISLSGGAGPTLDAIAHIQFPLIAGIFLGALFSAVLIKEFTFYYRVPARQYLSAFTGGIILALGSRMTPGCNIWHLFGGLPILAMQSILFLLGIFPGTFIGTFLLTHIVLRAR